MTSASEFFYTRRSRVGRPDHDSGIGYSIDWNYNRRNNFCHHNQRHDLDGCVLSTGLPKCVNSAHVPPPSLFEYFEYLREMLYRIWLCQERSSVLSDQGNSQFVSGNGLTLNTDGVSNSSRQSLSSNERLPTLCCVERLGGLPVEIFSSGTGEVDVETKLSSESRDCSISVGSFGDKDVLTRLSYRHSFQLACLDTRVRACGDCPYCRRSIL